MLCQSRFFLLGGVFIESTKIPFWERYTLTIHEASQYFRIGESKLRALVNENPDANYILWNGNRIQIKRKLFEAYIDLCQVI